MKYPVGEMRAGHSSPSIFTIKNVTSVETMSLWIETQRILSLSEFSLEYLNLRIPRLFSFFLFVFSILFLFFLQHFFCSVIIASCFCVINIFFVIVFLVFYLFVLVLVFYLFLFFCFICSVLILLSFFRSVLVFFVFMFILF